MSVEEALRTPGALLFKFGSDPMTSSRPDGAHVAISLGDGTVMEAKGTKYGTEIFSAEGRGWTHAGWIPGLGGEFNPISLSLDGVPEHLDSDADGLRDRLEIYIGTDPYSADTDRDGFADIDELLEFRSDPLEYVSNPLRVEPTDPTFQPALTDADEIDGFAATTAEGGDDVGLLAEPSTGGADVSSADVSSAAGGSASSIDSLIDVDQTFVDDLRDRLDLAFGDRSGLLDETDLGILVDPTDDDYSSLADRFDWLPDDHDTLLGMLGDGFGS
jgi:hypothetical protein